MPRVEFRLTMPNVGSWNGRWSGEGRNYVVYKTLTTKQVTALALPSSFYHRWEDGWGANVSARVMNNGERRQKSDGFCGYDWMVRNILLYGSTREPDTGGSVPAPTKGE